MKFEKCKPHGESAETPCRGPLGRASLRSREQPAALRPPVFAPVDNQKRERQDTPVSLFFGSPTGTRTPVFAVRGRRLNRLTMRPYLKLLDDYSIKREGWQADFAVFFKKIKKIQRRGNGQKMHAECASVYLCNMCCLTFTAQGKFTELRSMRGDMRRTAQERAHSPCRAEK